MTPLITVLMPVYNGEKYLREAIDSILSQSHADFEFLIVNDGSTDTSEEIIRSYHDPRIRLINQKNGGVSAALNTGLQHAAGRFIARMDADDISHTNRLQTQLAFMNEHPAYVMIGSDVNYIDEDGLFLFRYHAAAHTNEEVNSLIRHDCLFVHSTVFFCKEPVLSLGGYNVHAHNFEDHLLWVNLLKQGQACILDASLVDYRFNPGSVTIDERDRGKQFRAIKQKALQTGNISQAEGNQMLEIIRGQNKRFKLNSYHNMLAKKYLWDNYQPRKARQHLRKALALRPLKPISYVLLFLSFFPKSTIQRLYRLMK